MTRPSGFAAQYPGDCPRCPDSIVVGDRVVRVGGQIVHVGCASGQDDQ